MVLALFLGHWHGGIRLLLGRQEGGSGGNLEPGRFGRTTVRAAGSGALGVGGRAAGFGLLVPWSGWRGVAVTRGLQLELDHRFDSELAAMK